jgi:hypothetical protein
MLKVIVKFTSEVVWLKLRYLCVFSGIGLFSEDLGNLLLSKFLRLSGWFRLSCSYGTLWIYDLLP